MEQRGQTGDRKERFLHTLSESHIFLSGLRFFTQGDYGLMKTLFTEGSMTFDPDGMSRTSIRL